MINCCYICREKTDSITKAMYFSGSIDSAADIINYVELEKNSHIEESYLIGYIPQQEISAIHYLAGGEIVIPSKYYLIWDELPNGLKIKFRICARDKFDSQYRVIDNVWIKEYKDEKG
jgi:hypothetical protein